MILRKIEVRNIRSYEHGAVNLREGITAFSGEIGSGKSTLLHALEMALFGFAEVDPEHLLRHGAADGEVEAVLATEASLVSFRRSFTRKVSRGKVDIAQKCSFARDGHRTSYSTTEMKRQVIELLGFPDNPNPRSSSDLWRWAVYVPQEGMRAVLVQDEEERLETIRRAHGLEEYRTARENSEELSRELRSRERESRKTAGLLAEAAEGREEVGHRLAEQNTRLVTLNTTREKAEETWRRSEHTLQRKRELERDQAVAAQGLQHLQAEVERTRREQKKGTERLQELMSRLEEQARAVTDLEQLLLRTDVQPDELHRQEVRVASLRASTEGASEALASLQKAVERRRASEAAYQEAEEQRLAAERKREERRSTVTQRRSELPPLPNLTEARRSLDELSQVSVDHQHELTSLAEEIGSTKHSENELRELVESGTCPRCRQRVEAQQFLHHLEQIDLRRKSLEARKSAIEEAIRNLAGERTRRESYEARLSAHREGVRRLEEAEQELREAEALCHDAQRSASQKRALVPELGSEVPRLEEAEADLNRARQEEREGSKWLDAVRTRVQEHQVTQERLRSSRELVTQMEREATRTREDLKRTDTAFKDLSEGCRTSTDLLQELAAGLTPLADAETQETEARRTFDQARESIAIAQRDLEHLQEELVRMEKAARQRAAAERNADLFQRLSQWLERFAAATSEIERRRFEGIHHEFAQDFARYFGQLVEDPSMTATLDPNFRPSVSTAGFQTPPEALSGGERTALALAYRLGLGRSVRSVNRLHLDTLVLDEPSDGFSAGQITKLRDLLRDLGHRQVILVSHDDNLTSIADRVISVTKEDGRSTAAG